MDTQRYCIPTFEGCDKFAPGVAAKYIEEIVTKHGGSGLRSHKRLGGLSFSLPVGPDSSLELQAEIARVFPNAKVIRI